MEASIIQANGRRFLLAYLQPGDIGGLISLLDRLPHRSDMLACTQGTVILTIQDAALRALGEKHPCITQALLVQMAYRACLLHERLVMNSSMMLKVRLARILCLLLRISVHLPPAEASAMLHMPQADLGDLLGVGRMTRQVYDRRAVKKGKPVQ